ncbi:hypothetical protein [Janthinobacterium lividum]|uniref:hypothetical protein n=1 Tax=Janthinobacterium lividum TaxID=29581 RepID=UPI00140A2287|nr:hypothetical protein [Janthinobacterium lividum]NHQ93061.1 hypothetical protein [Janthinobacterium lividum]
MLSSLFLLMMQDCAGYLGIPADVLRMLQRHGGALRPGDGKEEHGGQRWGVILIASWQYFIKL